MIVVDHPPALTSAAPIPSRNVMVWGDQAAQDVIRALFEKEGWAWLTLMLGDQTPALMLMPPASVTDDQITALINDVNAGKYGELNGGYGQIGKPTKQHGSTRT